MRLNICINSVDKTVPSFRSVNVKNNRSFHSGARYSGNVYTTSVYPNNKQEIKIYWYASKLTTRRNITYLS